MSVDVVGPETEPDRPSATVEQEPHGEAEVVRVDVRRSRVGDRFLLVVGALDQADRRIERPQALEVGRRPTEVRLEADARPRLGRAEPLVQRDRRLDIGAAFHVDPQVRPRRGGMLGDPDEVLEAGVGIEVEARAGSA